MMMVVLDKKLWDFYDGRGKASDLLGVFKEFLIRNFHTKNKSLLFKL